MNAELISVGTEILLGQIVNTNAAWLAQRLATFGVNVYRQVTVGDNLNRLAATITDSLSRADLLILTGGLGPTDDDLTREGVALATNRPLETDEAQKQWLIQRFQSRFGKMPENNLKQALKPKGSLILPNPNGTACGYAVPHLDKWIFLLPGPPWEMEAMFENEVVPLLSKYFDLSQHLFHRTLKFFGIGESALEMEVLDLMRSQVDPTMALYAGMGEVQMRLTTRTESKEEADIKLEMLHRKVAERVGIHIYG
ncbi:MAG: CinA family nicotinamide mononucleotide deamidase-related protein, partial [Petrimonas sp.]|nr:CinA family nicotinamide mononucleotide deamidase-related protein [Petrimonas sp.]